MIKQTPQQGLNYKSYLDTLPEEVKSKALQRRENLVIATEIKQQIEHLQAKSLVAYTEGANEDALIVLPYLEAIHEINPLITYEIIPPLNTQQAIPTIEVYNLDKQCVGKLETYPERFKKRIRGLDKEDTQELIMRYRKGYYNTELIEGLIALIKD